ncbi:MAG: hypothetical protein HYS27_11405 [Deltaproteobacteria bacterium]|nr:hypothetical protein [Deltaproteobacteria bacterium]
MAPLLLALALTAQAPSTALLPVVGVGLSLDELTRLDRELRREAERALGAELQRETVTRARLDAAAARGLRCDRAAPFAVRPGEAPSLDCLVQEGVVCEAERVLVAELARAGGEVRLMLLAVDVRGGTLTRQVVVRGKLDAEHLSDGVGRLADAERASAKLDARGAPPNAAWRIDGADASPPPWTLAAGRHLVAASAEGFVAREQAVDLASGATEVLELSLAAIPPPAAPPAVPPSPAAPSPSLTVAWPAVIGGAAAASLGVTLAGLGLVPRIAYGADVAELEALDAALREDPASIEGRASEAATLHARAETDAAAWSTWGLPSVLLGTALFGVGVGVAVGALVAGPLGPNEAGP